MAGTSQGPEMSAPSEDKEVQQLGALYGSSGYAGRKLVGNWGALTLGH